MVSGLADPLPAKGFLIHINDDAAVTFTLISTDAPPEGPSSGENAMVHVRLVDGPPRDIRRFDNEDELASKLTAEDVETIREIFHTPLTVSFNWDYENANAKIRRLYELGKRFNWNAQLDVDWDQPMPEGEDPNDSRLNAFAGHPKYEALTAGQKHDFAWRSHAQTLSQFLHGEQGAMLVASQLVSCAPTYDAKLYASSQTFDEARHVEVFHRYLQDRCKIIYPINANLKALLDLVLTDERWGLPDDVADHP
jgi:hypothetical protein